MIITNTKHCQISFKSHEHKEVALRKLLERELAIQYQNDLVCQKTVLVKTAIEFGLNRLEQEQVDTTALKARYNTLKDEVAVKRDLSDQQLLNTPEDTIEIVTKHEFSKLSNGVWKNQRRLAGLKQLLEEINATCGDLDEIRQKAKEAIEGFQVYNPKDRKYEELAVTLLNLCYDTTEQSQHSMGEFCAEGNEYGEFLKALSPECQQNSLDIRKALESIPDLQDPLALMIVASKMEKMVASADSAQLKNTIQSMKDFIVTLAEKQLKNGENPTLKGQIKDMLALIKGKEGLKFGDEFKLLLNQAIDTENIPPLMQEQGNLVDARHVLIPQRNLSEQIRVKR